MTVNDSEHLTNEQIEQILEGAPKAKWSHAMILSIGRHWFRTEHYPQALHHTADLEEILSLRQEVERLKEEVEESWHKGYEEGKEDEFQNVMEQNND